MPNEQQARQGEERATYLGLIGTFTGLLAAVAWSQRHKQAAFALAPADMALLGLATYRAGRLAAYDRVTEPLRAPVTETVPDEYDAGENVVAEGAGMQIAPVPTRALAGILAVSGLAEILDAGVEALTWSGQSARKRSAP